MVGFACKEVRPGFAGAFSFCKVPPPKALPLLEAHSPIRQAQGRQEWLCYWTSSSSYKTAAPFSTLDVCPQL